MSKHLERALPDALHQLAGRAPISPLDSAPIRRAVRRRRWLITGPLVAVLLVAGIVTGIALSRSGGTIVADPAASSTCTPLQTGALPVWARAGFTMGGYPPFATSRSGDVVAIVFGDPLSAPPAADHTNKILWVVRDSATGEMMMTARLEGSDRVVSRRVPAGPSIVDMPAGGCWHLDLRIGDRHHAINLRWN